MLALCAMIADHTSIILNTAPSLRLFGRLAMPLFAFVFIARIALPAQGRYSRALRGAIWTGAFGLLSQPLNPWIGTPAWLPNILIQLCLIALGWWLCEPFARFLTDPDCPEVKSRAVRLTLLAPLALCAAASPYGAGLWGASLLCALLWQLPYTGSSAARAALCAAPIALATAYNAWNGAWPGTHWHAIAAAVALATPALAAWSIRPDATPPSPRSRRLPRIVWYAAYPAHLVVLILIANAIHAY